MSEPRIGSASDNDDFGRGFDEPINKAIVESTDKQPSVRRCTECKGRSQYANGERCKRCAGTGVEPTAKQAADLVTVKK